MKGTCMVVKFSMGWYLSMNATLFDRVTCVKMTFRGGTWLVKGTCMVVM